MSEYQYYEFLAIDRPLSKEEMAAPRKITSRATITPTRLQNVYNYGDFGGEPGALMEKYFDAFLYLANWGTHQFMLRLPKRLLDFATASQYQAGESTAVRAKGDHVILEFLYVEEDGGDWVDDEEAEGWLPSIIPLRAELASGDLRALYLGWLLGAEMGELEDDAVEPPVPAGLGKLSASLQAFAEFMNIDEDLIAVAAERSASLTSPELPPGALRQLIHELPESEKEALLLRFVEGNDPHLRTELLRRFERARADTKLEPEVTPARRTVSELLKAAKNHAQIRRREEAAREAAERARRAREEAAARARYLDSLVGQQEEVWLRVEKLVEAKQAREYDKATQLLVDLRDMANKTGKPGEFAGRFARLKERSGRSSALLGRFNKAGL